LKVGAVARQAVALFVLWLEDLLLRV